METKEKNFEQDIESWLLTEGGYVKGNMWTYDKKRAIDMPVLIQFIEATQPKQWERYKNIYAEFSCDYDSKSDITKAFYMTMCNMMKKDKDLDLLTASFLGIAERRAHQHLLTTMTEWNELLINKTV